MRDKIAEVNPIIQALPVPTACERAAVAKSRITITARTGAPRRAG